MCTGRHCRICVRVEAISNPKKLWLDSDRLKSYLPSMIKILIIEDDSQIRMVYSYAFHNNGFKVMEAADAVTGLKLLDEHKPDIVLLDMLMPGISGLDFLRQNNIHHRYPEIKLIAFSNIETPRVVEEAKKLGVEKYFLKVDVTPHQMIEIIHQLVGSKKKSDVAL